MKTITSIIIFLFVCIHIYSQDITDLPPYELVNPKWQFFSKDLHFPIDNKGLQHTPYSCMNRIKSIEKGDYVYFLDFTFTAKTGYSGWDGFLLHKLNKYSGEIVWICQHNHHVGVKNFETPSPYIGFDSKGNIEILTTRDRDTVIKDYPYIWDIVGTPTVHTINDVTGERVNFRTGSDTTKFDNTRLYSGSRLHWQGEGKYLNLLYRTFNVGGLTKDRIEFHKVNDSLNIEREPVWTYQIDTDIETPYDLGYVPWIEHLYNSDTMVVLTGISNPIGDTKNSPKQAFLRWFDIQDHDNLQHLKTIEVTDAFARPQHNFWRYNPRLEFKAGHIFLTQIMQPDTKLPHEYFVWMWWLDSDGNILGKFPQVKWLDTFYLRIEPIGVKDNKLYMTGRYYNFQEGIERYDILEVEPYTNLPKKVGEFLKYNHNNANFRINIINADFLDNGDIYFDLSFKDRRFNLEYWFMSSVVVPSESLGITTPTQETETVAQTWSWIYPNPTADRLYVQLDEAGSVEVEIRDIMGRSVYYQQFTNEPELNIDLSFLKSGMYHITITDKTGRRRAMTHKVVRL